jgi:2'-5' RNA ligase
MPSIRSFIAIELPTDIRDCLELIINRLKPSAGDVRWVKADAIHLTLKFLGEVEEGRIPDIAACIEHCVQGIPPFTLALRGLGAFPGDNSPQVIWIAAADETGILAGMQRSLEEGLARVGFTKENRPFSPHLTLGRLKSPRGKEAVRRGLAELKHTDCGSFTADSVSLIKSDLTPGGPVYTVLQSFSLHTHD